MKRIYHMAVEAALDVIRGKWKPRILCHLGNGPMRPGELLRNMPGCSQKVLTAQLHELDEAGIVERRSYNEVPPHVEYRLAKRGLELRNILLELSDWGEALVKDKREEGIAIQIENPNTKGFQEH